MGDALATYFEARACQRSEVTSRAGGNTTGAAMALAELCFDTLMEVVKAACAEGDTLHNMPFTVTPEICSDQGSRCVWQILSWRGISRV